MWHIIFYVRTQRFDERCNLGKITVYVCQFRLVVNANRTTTNAKIPTISDIDDGFCQRRDLMNVSANENLKQVDILRRTKQKQNNSKNKTLLAIDFCHDVDENGLKLSTIMERRKKKPTTQANIYLNINVIYRNNTNIISLKLSV